MRILGTVGHQSESATVLVYSILDWLKVSQHMGALWEGTPEKPCKFSLTCVTMCVNSSLDLDELALSSKLQVNVRYGRTPTVDFEFEFSKALQKFQVYRISCMNWSILTQAGRLTSLSAVGG